MLLVCFQISYCTSAQTEIQKQMMFERINRDSRGSGILPKIAPIANKEELFNTAQVLPIFKVEFDRNYKVKLIQNKEYFLIFYLGRLYAFINNKDSRFFENTPVIQDILKFNEEKKEFFVVYFSDSFSTDGKYFNPLLSDKNVSFIIDKGYKSQTFEYLDLKYGSFNKYKERYRLDSIRENLSLEKIHDYFKNNYESFEYNCPKDTSLVLKTLMNQIRLSTKNFTKNQEAELFRRIKGKINPFELEINQLKETLTVSKISDSIILRIVSEAKNENKISTKPQSKVEGLYEYSIYNVNFTNELLEILTNEQFIDYKNYYDVFHPIVETYNRYYNNKYRYGYSKDILERLGVLKSNNLSEFKDYENKILIDCGCPPDKTIREN